MNIHYKILIQSLLLVGIFWGFSIFGDLMAQFPPPPPPGGGGGGGGGSGAPIDGGAIGLLGAGVFYAYRRLKKQ